MRVVQFWTYQVVADYLELYVNRLMANVSITHKFNNDLKFCCLVATGTLATLWLFYSHTPTNGQYRVEFNPTPARSVSCMIELAILTQNLATGNIFMNWCSQDNTGWWDLTICIVSGFHNNAIAKTRYDNRCLPIKHHLPQARHSGSYIPVLIRMEISHNSATIEEASKRQKPYLLFTGLGDHVRLHQLLETNPFWQKEC